MKHFKISFIHFQGHYNVYLLLFSYNYITGTEIPTTIIKVENRENGLRVIECKCIFFRQEKNKIYS